MNNTITTIENNRDTPSTINKIKKAIVSQVSDYVTYPLLYSVITFSTYDNYGCKLPISQVRKYWDKQEVEKTCILLRNMLKETFSIERTYFFVERHADLLDEDGETQKKGRFHINLVATTIADQIIEDPSRKVKRLLRGNGRLGVPIENQVYEDLEDLKIDLFNACLRQADWVNKWSGSVLTQWMDGPTDAEAVVQYSLKDYKPGGHTDFTDIIVWKASDFYRP
jgi:hypothetical protein